MRASRSWQQIQLLFLTVGAAVLGPVGNQISFAENGLAKPVQTHALLIFFAIVAFLAVVSILMPSPVPPPVLSSPLTEENDPNVTVLESTTEAPAKRARLPIGDRRVSLVMVAVTVLGAIGLLIWPQIVAHQARQGAAVTVKIGDKYLVKTGDHEYVDVRGTVRRSAKEGHSYWLMQRLHYAGTSESDDEFYPKARLEGPGKYRITLDYELGTSLRSNARTLYVAQMPDETAGEFTDKIKDANAFQDDPCPACAITAEVRLVL